MVHLALKLQLEFIIIPVVEVVNKVFKVFKPGAVGDNQSGEDVICVL